MLHTLLKVLCSPGLTGKFYMQSLVESHLFTDTDGSGSWAENAGCGYELWNTVKNGPFAPSRGLSSSFYYWKQRELDLKHYDLTVLSFLRSDNSQINNSCVNTLQVTELLSTRSHVRVHSLINIIVIKGLCLLWGVIYIG